MISLYPVHVIILVMMLGLLLALFWPTLRSGRRLLRNWGVPEATREQAAVAKTYLLSRRVLYVVFIVVIGQIVRTYTNDDTSTTYVGSVLAGLLLSELVVAVRPVRGGTRVASLSPRTWRSLLTRWSVVAHLITVGLVLACSLALMLAGQPFDAVPVIALVSLLAVYGLVRLAVIRPAVGDLEVDTALRIRTARVMVGIGTMLGAQLLSSQLLQLSTVTDLKWARPVSCGTVLVGAVVWILITNPLHKPATRTASV